MAFSSTLNLDLLPAWDCRITFGGRTAEVRFLSQSDLRSLSCQAEQMKSTLAGSDEKTQAEAVVVLLSGLLAEPAESVLPWLKTFGRMHLIMAVTGIATYTKNFSLEMNRAISAMIEPTE